MQFLRIDNSSTKITNSKNENVKSLFFYLLTVTHAIVTPKSGKGQLLPQNYRSIGLLPEMSKIVERIIEEEIRTQRKAEHFSRFQLGYKNLYSIQH